ncbi:MAG: AMP-binding protein [Spirochaetaceae bacterium]|nr:AMP-binding protein [Spirochaetaceae bacterium]MCF7950072.1 AMP-binding protein [Spirochaetaceae bacterium]
MVRLKALTLENLLVESTEKYGHYDVLSYVDEDSLSYKDFYDRVVSLRYYLKDKGIKKGDRVILLSENQPHWAVCYFAVTTLGAVVVPILTDFHTEEIANIINHSEPSAFCVSVKLLDKIRTSIEDSSKPALCIDSLSELPRPVPAADLKTESKTWEQIQLQEHEVEMSGVVAEDDTASIIYTSGTTGKSKGVMLSHRNLVYDAEASADIPRLKPGDRLLSILPLAHTYECTVGLITPLLLGSHVVYLKKPPAPVVLLPALKQVRPHTVLSVPLLIEKIYRSVVLPKINKTWLSRSAYKLPPLRKLINRLIGRGLVRIFGGNIQFFGIGGAALAEDVEFFLREARFPYAIGYGLTETAPLIAGCGPAYTRYRSTGPILTGVTVKIDQPDAATGEGEILVKGPIVMQGYFKEPEKTAEVLTPDGWFHTGDLGLVDEDGYLFIRGRLKNMILGPSGENIYPEEIEALINEYDFVNESLVVEEEGRLIAMVHIDYDSLREQVKDIAESAVDISKQANEYLTHLKQKVNKRLNAFSRVSEILEENEPFEKTPTRKIKRYLYTQLGNKHKIETKENDNAQGK